MILFKRRNEKQQEKEKEGHEKMRKEEEEQHQMKEKEKKEKEKQKDIDLAKLSPIPIAKDEQALYRYNVSKGTFRTKVITSYFVTNYRIMTIFAVNNNPQIPLENISDVVAINTHREYEGGYQGYSTSSRGFRYILWVDIKAEAYHMEIL